MRHQSLSPLSPLSPEMTGLQQAFGHWWEDPSLLRQALTHCSTGGEHNQRLEFLGDSVLDLTIGEWLMNRHPEADEGFLSQGRAALVRESSLADMARRLGLGAALIVKPGHDYLRSVDSVLADAFEAVVGALYQDSGSLRAVRQGLLHCGFFL